MKNSISLLICLFVIIATSAAIRAQVSGIGPGRSWNPYTVKDEEFSVNLPALPAMMTSEGRRKGDGKRRLERLLKTSVDGVDFTIEAFENPEPRQSLEQFIAELGLSSNYDRGTERKLIVDGFTGIEYSSSNNTTPARVQFFATETHLYRFVASGQGPRRPRVEALFFLQSSWGRSWMARKFLTGPDLVHLYSLILAKEYLQEERLILRLV